MTAQRGDLIQYEGCYYLIGYGDYPLESHVDAIDWAQSDFFATAGKGELQFSLRTDCWRGYVAIWQVLDGQLFLKDVRAPSLLKSYREALFTRYQPHQLIPADWFSGQIVLIGLFDSEENLISQSPPNLTNLHALNDDAETEDWEPGARLLTVWDLEIKHGDVMSTLQSDRSEYISY